MVSPRSDAGPKAGSTARDDQDIFRLTQSMDVAVLETIAARLEFRGKDEGYARLSQAYFPRLPLHNARRILALGCGTGVEVRALRRLTRWERGDVQVLFLQLRSEREIG